MIILHDPICAEYGSAMRPEQPARVLKTAPYLQKTRPDWTWQKPNPATEADLLRAHTPAHLSRLKRAPDFDEDTPYYPGIFDHANRSAGSAIDAAALALTGQKAFSLMRPPGHHCTSNQAMGFCYLNSIAIAALAARAKGVARVAIWDFDAHHGNGTEAILHQQPGFLFCSVHQYPGYPGTGTHSFDNCINLSIEPNTSRGAHMSALEKSFSTVLAFKPELILVSAGFDAYTRDPITAMTLESEDFETLGQWLGGARLPAAAILEGGYSSDLPLLIDSFLTAWVGAD